MMAWSNGRHSWSSNPSSPQPRPSETMPVPATKSAMLPVDEVLRTAIREHPEMESGSGEARRVMEEACEVLARGPVKVSRRCLLRPEVEI